MAFETTLLLLLCHVTCGLATADGIYHVERRDFVSNQLPPQPRTPSSHQHLVNGRNGVYQVDRRDFTGTGDNVPPFSWQPGFYYDYYSPDKDQKNRFAFGIGVPPYYTPYFQSSASPSPLPRLFIPAVSSSYDRYVQPPNYKNVLSLSEYNRRFDQPPSSPASSYSRPAVNAFGDASPTNVPPFWMAASASASVSTIAASTPYPPASTWSTRPLSTTYSPPPAQATAYVDDGVLPPIRSNEAENEPLPAVATLQHSPPAHSSIIERQQAAAADRHTTTIKYISFDEFVEISDEHRELLESFGPIQNNDSDFSGTPPSATPIRRRRYTPGCDVRSLLLRGSRLVDGRRLFRGGFEQRILDARIRRLRRQMAALAHLRRALRDENLTPATDYDVHEDDYSLAVADDGDQNSASRRFNVLAVAVSGAPRNDRQLAVVRVRSANNVNGTNNADAERDYVGEYESDRRRPCTDDDISEPSELDEAALFARDGDRTSVPKESMAAALAIDTTTTSDELSSPSPPQVGRAQFDTSTAGRAKDTKVGDYVIYSPVRDNSDAGYRSTTDKLEIL